MPAMDTEYDNLRENVADHYARLTDAQLESLMARNGMDAEAMEGFFDSLKSFASTAGNAVLGAAPSILPAAGTILGTAFGGPIGAQLGGTLGSLAGKAVGAATAPGGSASGAAGQLLQTIARPETLQALGSMAMGGLGKSSVSVGGTSVPVGAFGTLLKSLIGQAETEYAEALAAAEGDGTPAYMRDFSGQPVADPAVPLNRAVALYQLLQATGNTGRAETAEGFDEADAAELDMESMQAEYDEMELAEVYDSEEG
jgi:hypothetical protein